MRLNNFTKKNYIEIEKLFKIILKHYKKISIKGIDRNKNLVGFFFHDLMFYFASLQYQKNLKKNNRLRFGYRNNFFLFKKHKKNRNSQFIYKVYNLFSKLLFHKTLYFGYGIKLSLAQKIYLVLLSSLNGYRIELINNLSNRADFENFNFQKKILYSLIKYLSKYYKLSKKDKSQLNIDVNIFIKKIISKKKIISMNNNKVLIGSSANIFNRIAATQQDSKISSNIIFGHENHTGFTNNLHLRFNEFQYADRYVCNGISDKRLLKNSINYYNLQNKFPRLIHRGLRNKVSNLTIDGKIEKISELKGLYIPTRIELDVINSAECINHLDYQKWQNFLLSHNKNIFIKPHPKQTYKIEKIQKRKIVNGNLSEVIKDFDYLIFDFVSSAAFGEVVTSNKQIIYFNIGLSSFTDIGKKLFFKRVHKIDVDLENKFEGYRNFHKTELSGKTNEFSQYFCNSESNFSFINKIFV